MVCLGKSVDSLLLISVLACVDFLLMLLSDRVLICNNTSDETRFCIFFLGLTSSLISKLTMRQCSRGSRYDDCGQLFPLARRMDL